MDGHRMTCSKEDQTWLVDHNYENRREAGNKLENSHVQMCRICFTADRRLFSMLEHKKLREAYENLTSLETVLDGLPAELCGGCARRASYWRRYRARALRAHAALQELARAHAGITPESVKRFKESYWPEQPVSSPDCSGVEELETDRLDPLCNNLPEETATVYIKAESSLQCDGDTDQEALCNDKLDGGKAERGTEPEIDRIPNILKRSNTRKHTRPVYKPSGIPLNQTSKPIAQFFCDICDKVFTAKSYLSRHMKIHTKRKMYPCNVCKKVFRANITLVKHMITHSGEKPFSCEICEKAFSLADALQKHLKTHAVKSYSCDTCKKSFRTKFSLEEHSRTHSGETPFPCTACGKGFKFRSNLQRHLKTHSGEKPFSCHICEKSFIQNISLQLHLRSHSGEKSYACSICQKEFRLKYSLKFHLMSHFGIKPYSCELCQKSYSDNGSLQRHLKTHSGEKPFSCKLCKKAFTFKSKLKDHLKIHTGVRPYTCNVCSKSFRVKSTLIIHLRTHSGEKPYLCEICTRAFSQKQALKTHSKIHSREKADCFVINVSSSQ